MTPLRRKLGAITFSVVAAASAVIGLSSTAQAATNYSGKMLCADQYSNYSSYVRFVGGGSTTFVADPGRCVPLPFEYVTLEVVGIRANGSTFSMGQYPSWKPPANIKTAGKVWNWTWWAY